MKRTTLFVALASAISLSAYAHDQSRQQSSQNDQSQQQRPKLSKARTPIW